MQITERKLRQIIREELLREAMMTTDDAEERNIRFRVKRFSDIIMIDAIRWDDETDIVGTLWAEKLHNPCEGAWEITKSNVSSNFDGLGPLLYELMIDLVHPDPLTSDRASVSQAAKRVWDYYMQRRDDIESLPLDNMRDERTPGVEEDNCGQNSALMWSSEEKPWHSLSLARAYKRKGGETPIWDDLDGLDIIDMFVSKKIKKED
jgi:hypothetical protein